MTPTGHHSLQNTWGLVFAFLFLGLGIGGFLGYKVILEKPKVNIIIDTVPPGAKVFDMQNKIDEGETPFAATKKNPGIYKYKVYLDGYKDQVVELRLRDINKTESKRIELTAIDSPPIIEEKENINEKEDDPEIKEVKDPKKIPEKKEPEDSDDLIVENGLISAGGLIWQANDIKRMNWYSAVTHCRNLGMRLPSKQELKIGYNTKLKTLSRPCCEYWSSTPHEQDPENAYNIHMGNFESFYSSKSNVFYVRCVAK